MKPVDIRNENFASIYHRLEGDRLDCYLDLKRQGEASTRALAERMHRDILTVRPRVCELCQMGAVELVGRDDDGGIYRARGDMEWMDWFRDEHLRATTGEQELLNL
jgi:predicted transcriptional regulator